MIKIKYYINKRCTKKGGSKNAKKPNKKGFFIIYQRTKVLKMNSLKNEGVNKLTYYIKWKP
jgi:hypothetical protein